MNGNEIDLIPNSYRRRLAIRRMLTPFAAAYAVVFVCLIAAKFFLSASIDLQTVRIQQLQADKNSVLQRKAYIDQLSSQAEVLAERVEMLEKLRGGPPVQEVFIAVDKSLAGRVWFRDWKFMRAGEFVDVVPQAVNTGYFIIVPETQSESGVKAWRMRTHMEINAQAIDHSALADFVKRLNAQAHIESVKVLNTRSRHEGHRRVVDFDLIIVVG